MAPEDQVMNFLDIRVFHHIRSSVYYYVPQKSLILDHVRLDSVAFLSLDVFDTALSRRVMRPTDIFRVMQPSASTVVGRVLTDFESQRVSAEREARVLASRQPGGSWEITLDKIYDQLQVQLNLSPEQRQKLVELELSTEAGFTYSNGDILALYNEACRLGRQVAFLSDMYLPAGYIVSLLEAGGYKKPQVYVSGEIGCSKHEGSLYQLLARQFSIKPGQAVHIGDNLRADVIQARRRGWRAIHYRTRTPRPPRSRELATQISNSVMLGLIHEFEKRETQMEAAPRDIWSWMGYTVAGPVYFAFSCWLMAQAKSTGIERIYPCSRDGYSVVRSLEILRETWKLHLDIRYLYASRKIYRLPTIKKLGEKELDFLLMATPGLTIRDIVERCNRVPEVEEPLLRKLGFESLDMTVTESAFGRFIRPQYGQWLREWIGRIEGSLLADYARDRELACRYLEQEGVHLPNGLIVDVGWSGTIVHSIQEILGSAHSGIAMKSCFFGTVEGAGSMVRPGGSLQSYFFHLGKPKRRFLLHRVCVELMELLFTAPHPTVVGLRENGSSRIDPIFGQLEHSQDEARNLAIMREAAFRFVADTALLLGRAPELQETEKMSDLVEERLVRLLLRPAPAEAAAIGAFGHWHGYGDKGTLRRLANLPARKQGRAHLHELVDAYAEAFWKKGLLVQVSRWQAWLLPVLLFVKSVRVAISSGTFWKSARCALFRKV